MVVNPAPTTWAFARHGESETRALAVFCRYNGRMKKRPFLAATGLALLAITSLVYLFPAAQQPTLSPAVAQPVQTPARPRITEMSTARYMADVTFLARDEM